MTAVAKKEKELNKLHQPSIKVNRDKTIVEPRPRRTEKLQVNGLSKHSRERLYPWDNGFRRDVDYIG